jgi:hypothetical protein
VSLVMMPPRHHLPALPFEIGGLQLNWYYFCQRELAHLLYLGITPFCTQSRGLVLNLKNSPTSRCVNDMVHQRISSWVAQKPESDNARDGEDIKRLGKREEEE